MIHAKVVNRPWLKVLVIRGIVPLVSPVSAILEDSIFELFPVDLSLDSPAFANTADLAIYILLYDSDDSIYVCLLSMIVVLCT